VRLILLIAVLAMLAACGHRGPLYIPGKPGDPAYDREHHDDPPKGGTPAGTRPMPESTSPADDSKTNGVNDSH
jgi:predicted small lipoprotein YifL